MSNEIKCEVYTAVRGNTILQKTRMMFEDRRSELSRMVVCTQDEQIKAALIKLGWTPPKEQK